MHMILPTPTGSQSETEMITYAKSAVSMAVALGGACATLAGNWQAVTEGRTLRTKIKTKSERVRELVTLLNDVKDTQEFQECRSKLHAELNATLADLDDLRKERPAGEIRERMNSRWRSGCLSFSRPVDRMPGSFICLLMRLCLADHWRFCWWSSLLKVEKISRQP